MSIVLVPIVVFLLFIVAIAYYINRAKSQTKIDSVYQKIDAINNSIKDIGIVRNAITNKVSNTESKYIRLHNLSRVFKYDDSDKYWIEFYIENVSSDDLNFNLLNIALDLHGEKVMCDLILLHEKVPEYLAPPYGNRYYNTEFFRNYILETKGQKLFCFSGRFALPIGHYEFSESDSIEINIGINKLYGDQFIEFEKVKFIESFSKLKFKRIQSINDSIKWLNE